MPHQPVSWRGIVGAILPHAFVVGAIGGGLWWFDHNAAERTRAELRGQLKDARIQLQEDLRASERRMVEAVGAEGIAVAARISDLDTQHRTIIQPTLIKELNRETRFIDPAAGITDGVRQTLNRSLAAGACSAKPSGGISCALPGAKPTAVE